MSGDKSLIRIQPKTAILGAAMAVICASISGLLGQPVSAVLIVMVGFPFALYALGGQS